LDGRKINLSVQTEYPFDGKIKVSYNGKKASQFSLRLRIPGWCETATASWTGQEKKTVESGRYLLIDRKWKKGDSVELQFEMPVQMIEPHPEVTANAGQVVFARGPLVYCLESEDVPYPVERARVAAMGPEEVDVRVTADWYPNLLEGIHKLKVPGLVDDEKVDLILVPWFVRASRSDSARWIIHLPQG